MIGERNGRIFQNVARFGRILRHAGIPIGTGKVMAAIEALSLIDIARRDDFRIALEATFVDRAEQRPLFRQAFDVFWRDPKLMERALQLMLPRAPGRLPPRDDDSSLNNRLRAAFAPPGAQNARPPEEEPVELDAALSVSPREVLAQRDFASMTLEEIADAKRMVRELRLPVSEIQTRRTRPHAGGAAIDMRATVRGALRTGGELLVLHRRRRLRRPPPIVVLCDISGSMDRYSRMLLHFLHAIGSQRTDFHAFTFGTRLTNVTRALRRRDVDDALRDVGRAVGDWSGGTRIGNCLHVFNRRWSRRVLGQGAVVLLVSDGLDCGDSAELAREMAFLRRSSRRVVWLNPLLRFAGFEPRASGVRAILPHVDDFVPAHNISSLSDLGRILSELPGAQTH